MEEDKACRCCHSQGKIKDMNSPYVWLGEKEVYSKMLHECFNIVLSKSQYYPEMICESCIVSLRSSLTFRRSVLLCEQELLKRAAELGGKLPDEKLVEVKQEPKVDSEDDSDDYFLADAMKDATEEIKVEYKPPKKKSSVKKPKKVATKKSADKSWRSEKIKSLVNRLASSINSCDKPEITVKKKRELSKNNRKIAAKDILNSEKVNLTWTSEGIRGTKGKHRENLLTILKFSNATPFKNKSLLGYICGYCDATYPDPIDLRRHITLDHKHDRLEFKSNFDLTEYNVKIDVTDLACTLCDETMDNLNSFKDHIVKIHNKVVYTDIKDHILQFKLKKGEIYDCAMCTARYETFKMLKQHMNKHYNNYTCPKCETGFATKRSLSAHRTTHQEGSFKCDHCDKIFATRAKQHYHEKTKHLGARHISNCPYCNESFRSYYQRNQHLVKVHNSEAQYKCNICNRTFILKSLLMYHIKKNHLMERNCQCTECGFRFFSKKALKAHMVKHTGERNFSCEICHKSYARKYTLREHLRIHNNDRRFKCDVCEMTFVQKCSLKSHLLSNHGISMAACEIVSN